MVDSWEVLIKSEKIKDIGDFEMTFIRAPYIEQVGNAKVLAKVEDKVVAVRYKNQLGLAFHPEMGNDNRIHKYFYRCVVDDERIIMRR